MFNKDKIKNLEAVIEAKDNRIRALDAEVADKDRKLKDIRREMTEAHADQIHEINRSYQLELRAKTEAYAELSERTSGYEEELSTLKEEKLQAEQALRDATKAKRLAEDALAEVEQKHKMQTELLEHNMTILTEAGAAALKSKELDMTRTFMEKELAVKEDALDKIASIKEECHERIQKEHGKRSDKFQEALETVLDRLPKVNVNAMLGGNTLGYEESDDE